MRWWTVYGGEVERTFAGERWTCAERLKDLINWVEAVDEPGLSTREGRIHTGLNSGYQAIGLAFLWGASRIVLLGYDMQRTGGRSHHHGDHEGGLPNLGTLPEWSRRMVQLAADLRTQGVEVINATRQTALTCFERLKPEEVLEAPKPALILQGMHGLGDNLHQRAIVRELMRKNDVWLKTSWPQIYWDMPRLHLLPLRSPICWMAKNESRSAALYAKHNPPNGRALACAYPPSDVKATGSVLGAMAKVCGVKPGDFRIPIAPAWGEKADALLLKLAPRKPVLIYRPPVAIEEPERLSSRAKVARNPDLDSFSALIAGIRERFFVISLADVREGHEWLVGPQIEADAEFHKGELDFETIAALTARASLVFCSPGFMTVMAQAVGTPMICVFGGFEGQASFSSSPSPWLPIEPVTPCACWSPSCKHDKTIDVAGAHARIGQFIEERCKPC